MRKEFYGLEHPEVAASLANVGCIHCVMGDLETAKKFFQSSHALRKNMYGEEHPCVASWNFAQQNWPQDGGSSISREGIGNEKEAFLS